MKHIFQNQPEGAGSYPYVNVNGDAPFVVDGHIKEGITIDYVKTADSEASGSNDEPA